MEIMFNMIFPNMVAIDEILGPPSITSRHDDSPAFIHGLLQRRAPTRVMNAETTDQTDDLAQPKVKLRQAIPAHWVASQLAAILGTNGLDLRVW